MLRRCPYCGPAPAGPDARSARINPVTTALRHLDALTDREVQVLSSMPGGESNTDLAESLGITERTVKFHVTNMREKLGGLSRAQLHLLALFTEVVQPCHLCRPDLRGRAVAPLALVPRGPVTARLAVSCA
ncbi:MULTISPECIES: helix-turn-helix domain-containing protein [unclassified Streptomyces]|uniref:helix-turn-helix domain-containing protein n=1 Tax=unclassified Streptomyces TaxID=2593676 RepID=UPI0016602D0F|nr:MULTISPECIES: helix-turn-helix transcriptional regulator [unclassified Streptomyces]MBD0707179.1 hypothetical protein [Streptomyces sp. CBMA291]MBD0713667.1 hypothetical protein [Streptomyces sp. CBMA370]